MKRSVSFIIFFLLFYVAQSQIVDSTTFPDRIFLQPELRPFYHGVASGDALADRVIIWTRVTPDTAGPVAVNWRVATDTSFCNVVASGVVYTNSHKDYTVKIDVTGLRPDNWYFYSFQALGRQSLIGRTKTLPVGNVSNIRVAVVSGSNYNAGYFNVYRVIGNRNDIDGVYHLGDYIYEYANNDYGQHPDRYLQPANELVSLSDYRMRYSHYHLDQDLMYAHQQYPWYTIWDDHEVCNNSYKDGGENHNPSSEGSFQNRLSAAIEAYYEWLPIRLVDSTQPKKIYRKISYGNMADVCFLETRYLARDKQDGMDNDDVNKHMLGMTQMNWLVNNLTTSTARWKIVAQQVMMAPLTALGITLNQDQWDGYQNERNYLFNVMKLVNNVAVLTGDIHTSWSMDLPASNYNPSTGQNAAGVEFVTPSVTSASFPFNVGLTIIRAANPHIKYIDVTNKGYYILDISQWRTQADWYFVNTIASRSTSESYNDGWYMGYNEKFVRHATSSAVRTTPPPIKPPVHPNQGMRFDTVFRMVLPMTDTLWTWVTTRGDTAFVNRFIVRNMMLGCTYYSGIPGVCPLITNSGVIGSDTILDTDTILPNQMIWTCDTTERNFYGSGEDLIYCRTFVCNSIIYNMDTIFGTPQTVCDTIFGALHAITSPEEKPRNAVIIGVHPNPFNNSFTVQYYIDSPGKVTFSLNDVSGKTVIQKNIQADSQGVKYQTFYTGGIKNDVYVLVMKMAGSVTSRWKIIKQ